MGVAGLELVRRELLAHAEAAVVAQRAKDVGRVRDRTVVVLFVTGRAGDDEVGGDRDRRSRVVAVAHSVGRRTAGRFGERRRPARAGRHVAAGDDPAREQRHDAARLRAQQQLRIVRQRAVGEDRDANPRLLRFAAGVRRVDDERTVVRGGDHVELQRPAVVAAETALDCGAARLGLVLLTAGEARDARVAHRLQRVRDLVRQRAQRLGIVGARGRRRREQQREAQHERNGSHRRPPVRRPCAPAPNGSYRRRRHRGGSAAASDKNRSRSAGLGSAHASVRPNQR